MSVFRKASEYSNEFYLIQRDGSLRSARRLLPMVFAVVHPRSVVDMGCGLGTWLSVAQQLGVDDILGLDGDHVDRGFLAIPTEKFVACDLSGRLPVHRSFDLALCLEVVEHLPASAAPNIVAELVRMAPVVLFSAAVPGQGGVHHVNEQWPEYWQALFARHGYSFCDYIRPRAWNESEIEVWYRQNTFLIAQEQWLKMRPDIGPAVEPLSRIHPTNWDACTQDLKNYRSGRGVSIRHLVRMFPPALACALRARLLGAKR